MPLSRERIVAAALALVEDAGLPAFTFRRLGEALGCEAMSVYHYFPSKRHLLDALVEHALAGIGEPPAELGPDRPAALPRPGVSGDGASPSEALPLVALHRLNMPAGVAFIERMLRHFHAALPDDRLAAQAFRIFGYYVIGAALDETAGYAAGPSAAEPVTDEFIARECPRLAAAAPFFKRPYFESTFELRLRDDAEGHRRPSRQRCRRTSRARPSRSCGRRRDRAPATRCRGWMRARSRSTIASPFIQTGPSCPFAQRGSILGSILGILVCGVAGGYRRLVGR